MPRGRVPRSPPQEGQMGPNSRAHHKPPQRDCHSPPEGRRLSSPRLSRDGNVSIRPSGWGHCAKLGEVVLDPWPWPQAPRVSARLKAPRAQ